MLWSFDYPRTWTVDACIQIAVALANFRPATISLWHRFVCHIPCAPAEREREREGERANRCTVSVHQISPCFPLLYPLSPSKYAVLWFDVDSKETITETARIPSRPGFSTRWSGPIDDLNRSNWTEIDLFCRFSCGLEHSYRMVTRFPNKILLLLLLLF